MTRTIDAAGRSLIRQFEGLKLDAYRDVAGVWTIGYGHTRGVRPGLYFTREQADLALQDDLMGAECVVNSAVDDAATTDHQFAAMVSLCYNIGSGNFRASSVLRDHLAGSHAAAAAAFLLWNKACIAGVLTEVEGLTRRRQAESMLYLTP